MIYLILPRGNNFGWGICGKYLVKELSEITNIKYITDNFSIKDIGDEFDFHFLKSKLIGEAEALKIKNGTLKHVDYPVLQAINDHTLQPFGINLKGTFKAGYTFFEENILDQRYIQNGRDNYDIIITGSKWCEEVLRKYGLEKVTTIIQGIDPLLYNSSYSEKEFFRDHFMVFSGGKFELRKGQDIVIKAYKVLQDRHKDVMLVNSWFNFWADSMKTMAASPHIKFEITSNNYIEIVNKTLQDNGIDLDRVITLSPRHNALMARMYQNTDIGIFPNRCEGGTNLVLMEYMACGKPTIASHSSGHKDIINANNSIMIKQIKPMSIYRDGNIFATWDAPDLDETIGHLEWAYQNREKLRYIGLQAGKDLSQLTWKRSAEEFFKILVKGNSATAELLR
ncbi:MAG: glycosyltransferase family 4 protein [Candidatus Scalinduaceae bacterium]